MNLETHSSKVELPHETTQAEAHQAGLVLHPFLDRLDRNARHGGETLTYFGRPSAKAKGRIVADLEAQRRCGRARVPERIYSGSGLLVRTHISAH
jgi:hypothetical protein